jgi:hypothetical protein
MLRTVNVTIEGLTPMLCNRFHEDEADQATSGVRSRQERPGPEEDAKSRLYQNGHGTFVPAENVRQSIIAASSRTKIGRRAATTDVAAAVYISPFELSLDGEWHVDSRAVVIPATKGRILRHRPMFDDWSLTFDLQIETNLIDEKTVHKIIEDAGNYVGLGDFRPARKGPYGRFQVTKWEVMK